MGLSRGRNAKAIWQDLVDGYGFTGAYQSVKRFIRKFRGKQLPEARAVIETAPGEETPGRLRQPAPWSAIRNAANTGAHGCSC